MDFNKTNLTIVWFWRVAHHLSRVRLAFAAIAIPAFACWYLWIHGATEPHIRWVSLALQVLGVLTVAIGVVSTRKEFGHPSIYRRTARFSKEWPRYPRAIVGVAACMQAAGTSSATATATIGIAPERTVEARLLELERQTKEIVTRLANETGELRSKLDEQRRLLDAECEQRSQADGEIQKKLEMTATGGLDLSLCGVVWLLLGSILGTIPNELAFLVAKHF